MWVFSSILFVFAAGKDELCGVRLNLEPAFPQSWMWFQWRREISGAFRMWWHFSAASVHGKELGEAPAKDKSRVLWVKRGCSKQPEEILALRLKQEDGFYK